MIVPHRPWVRQMRRRVRARVQADPVLRRERSRAPPIWRRQLSMGHLRWIVPLIAFGVAFAAPPQRLFDMALLWTTCITFGRAQRWAEALHSPANLAVFYALPVTNAAVFDHQRAMMLRGSIWLAADWLGLGLGWAVHAGRAELAGFALLLAIAQGGVAAALTVWAVGRWPHAPYPLGVLGSWILFFVCAQFYENGSSYRAFVAPLVNFLAMATPAGWLSGVGRAGLEGAGWSWAVVIAAGIAAFWILRLEFAAQRAKFSLESVIVDPDAVFDSDETRETDDASDRSWNDEAAAPGSAPVDPIPARNRWRELSDEPPGLGFFSQGWLGRWIARRLSLRQRVIADFLQARGAFNWSKMWLLALLMIAFSHLLAVVDALWWSGVLSGGALAFFAVPLFGGNWPGLAGAAVFHARIGMQSLVPVGFWEVARLMLRTNALRILAAFPLLVLASRHGFTADAVPWGTAFDYSVRGTIALLALQPLWVVIGISRTTNDTSSRTWFKIVAILTVVLGVFFLMAAGGVLFGASRFSTVALAAAALLVATHAALAFYGWSYRRGIFDLVAFGREPEL